MAQRLKDKVALVVGAGSVGPGWGNGKATAALLAREGAKVFCADVNEHAANETVDIIQEENGLAAAIRADVTCHDDIRRMVRVLSDWGCRGQAIPLASCLIVVPVDHSLLFAVGAAAAA